MIRILEETFPEGVNFLYKDSGFEQCTDQLNGCSVTKTKVSHSPAVKSWLLTAHSFSYFLTGLG
jgi:hypothetical protein